MADKSSREKKRHRVFMTRSGALYQAMRQRLGKDQGVARADLPFTLAELRLKIRNAISWGECIYLEQMEPLNEKNFSLDHETPTSRGGKYNLENITVCSQRANYAKGSMNKDEFLRLLRCLHGMPPEIMGDVIGRLRAATASRHRVFGFRKPKAP